MYSTISSACIHVGLVYVFYYIYEMGFFGICLATSLHFCARFFINVTLSEFSGAFQKYPEAKLFSSRSIENLND